MFRPFVNREHVDLNAMCRLCLCDSAQFAITPENTAHDEASDAATNPDHSPMIDIFHNPSENNCSLPLRIMACLGLAVQPTDSLPKHLCPDCRQLLEQFYWFRKRAHNSDTLLRRHQRLCNAGKPSRVFAARADDDDDDEDADCAESRALFESWAARRNAAAEAELRRALDEQEQRLERERQRAVREAEERVETEMRTQIEVSLRAELEQLVRADMESKWQQLWTSKPAAAVAVVAAVEQEAPAAKRQRIDFQEESVEFELTADTEFEIAFDEEGDDNDQPEQAYTFVDETGQTLDVDQQLQIVAEDDEAAEEDDVKASASCAEYLDDDDEEDAPLEEQEFEPDEDDDEQHQQSYADEDGHHQLLAIDELDDDEQNDGAAEADVIEHYIGEEEFDGDDDDVDAAEAESEIASQVAESVRELPERRAAPPRRRLNTRNIVAAADRFRFRVKSSAPAATQVEVSTGIGDEVLMVELVHGSDGKLAASAAHKAAAGAAVESTSDFGCTDCAERFARRYDLCRHQAAVHERAGGKGTFVCEHCDRPFPSNSSLVRHMRTHTGEKPFRCEVCGRSFIQKEILKRHSQVHTGERPFACDQCDRTFTQRELLRQHVNRQHSAEPVIELRKCGLCSKSFYHASGLSRHMLLHTGKKFGCEFCDKEFNDKSALRRHEGTLHAEAAAMSRKWRAEEVLGV